MSDNDQLDWIGQDFTPSTSPLVSPLHYQIRTSHKAKRLHLKIFPTGQIEVVSPAGFNHKKIPYFVGQHREWIERTLTRIRNQLMNHPGYLEMYPTSISLLAIGEQYQIRQRGGIVFPREVVCKDTNQRFLEIENVEKISYPALNKWLADKARTSLVPWLEKTSQETGLAYSNVIVRGQKSRWGSCSQGKNISINRSLLFLPARVVRYLFIHELCHTVYMNHSRHFWRLVKSHEPEYKALEKELARASYYVPLWAMNREARTGLS